MVGQKLSELLESKKIKPGTLATLTGIPKSTIYSIIRRNNKNVDFSVMEKIADALDVPVEYFYDRSSASRDEAKKEPTVPEGSELDELSIQIADILLRLSPEKKTEALHYLQYLEAREDK